MKNDKIITTQDLLEIESIRSKIKHPKDINKHEEGRLLNDYFSNSKGKFIPLLDMPLSYMVRAFNKTLQELYNLKNELDNLKENRGEENRKFKVVINTDESYSQIVEAQNLDEARDKTYSEFFDKGGDEMKLVSQNLEVLDVEEIK
jgi:hypothetical protein